MAVLPPSPVDAPFGSYNWQDWYEKVRRAINEAGSITWSQITDFTGSNLNQIATRSHQSLQNILPSGAFGHTPTGGSTGEVLTKNSATDYDYSWAAGGGGSGGTKTYAVFTPMNSMPPASNYAALDTTNSFAVLRFNDIVDRNIFWIGIIPEAASFGSGLKVRIHWFTPILTVGDVVWSADIMNLTNLLTNSYDTAATVTTTTSGTAGNRNVSEITLTAVDGLVAKDSFSLRVTRLASSGGDNLVADAYVFAVELEAV